MGGLDEPSNIIELTIEEHALAHKELYEKYGLLEDRLAWKGLSGQIGKEDILKEIYRQNGKRCGKANIGRIPWNKGVPMSEEQKEKMRGPKTGKSGRYERTEYHRKILSDNGKKPKSEITKQKLSDAAKKQFDDPEARRAVSERMKVRATCPHCGYISNKSCVTRHIKSGACKL